MNDHHRLNANATPRYYVATDPDEIAGNVASIGDEVPASILPDTHPARLALVWLASSGRDVYAYWSGGHITGTPVVWLGPLADVRPEKDGRVRVAEWRDRWRELLCEMGITLPSAETATAEGEARL